MATTSKRRLNKPDRLDNVNVVTALNNNFENLDDAVPDSRKVNGKALSSDVAIGIDDIPNLKDTLEETKSAFNDNVFSKNLLGTEGNKLYPVFLPAGTVITAYTSDDQTGAVYYFRTYDENKTRTHYWTIPSNTTTSGATSRTITLPDDAFYIDWLPHESTTITGMPMAEIGNVATGYTPWFPSVKALDERISQETEELSDRIDDLTDDVIEKTDIEAAYVVDGFITQSGNYNYNASFKIKKYQVKSGDNLELNIAFPYVSSGGVFQFQSAQNIPYSSNPNIIGSTYTTAFSGTLTVPDGANWLMVVSKADSDTNSIKVKKIKGIAEIESEIEDIKNDTDKLNYAYKLRNFKQVSDQYKKGNISGSWYDRFVLLHISDNHVSSSGTGFPARNLAELTNIANDKSVNAVINSGDMTNAGSSSLTRTDVNAMFDNYTAQATVNESASIPIISTLGNHDANDVSTASIANATTKADQWDNVFAPIAEKYSGIVWGDSEHYKHYHYYDLTKGSYKLRIIALDSLDHADYSTGDSSYECQWWEVYSQDQIDWLCETALNVPSGDYGIIVVNHFPFAPRRNGYSEDWPALNDGYFAQGWKMIPEIIRAWSNRTTLQKSYQDSKLGLNNITVNADFSDIPDGALFVCYMVGHTHSKNAFTVKEENGEDFEQLMLCEDSSGQQGSALNRVYKYDDGIQNTAASQITIDMNQRKVYRTAYGAYQHCSENQSFPTQIFDF